MIRMACFAALCAALTAVTSAQGIARQDGTTVLAPNQAMAESVLAEALAVRDRVSKLWLGRALSAAETETAINVILSQELHESTRSVDGPQGRFFRIAIWTHARQSTGAGLQRAMTKLVLAADAKDELPAWAITGAACLVDDPMQSRQRREIISWFQRTGNWPKVEQLLSEKKLGQYDRAGIAMAGSLTEFLLSRADRTTFLEFAKHGPADWNTALRRYYQVDDVDRLQRQWQDWTSLQTGIDQTARAIPALEEVKK